MLGSDPLPLSAGLLKTPHPTPKTDKGTVINLYLWVATKDSWADEWPNHNLSSLVASNSIPWWPTRKCSHPVTFLVLSHQLLQLLLQKTLQKYDWPARIRLKSRWLEERKFIMIAGQHLDISKMVLAPSSVWLGFLYLEESSSKQAGSTEADVAFSFSRLQYIMSAQLWTKALCSF
jgi:hypothetical protein